MGVLSLLYVHVHFRQLFFFVWMSVGKPSLSFMTMTAAYFTPVLPHFLVHWGIARYVSVIGYFTIQ